MATRSATQTELERAAATLPVVLFDGACSFCARQARVVRALARGRLLVRPLQEALPELPWVDPEQAVQALTLVRRDGRTVAGAEAVVELLRLARPGLGALAAVYYLPGLRQLADLGYRVIAARRYALFGTVPEHPACDGGACGRGWAARGGGAVGDQSTSTGRSAASSVRTTTPPSSDSSQRE